MGYSAFLTPGSRIRNRFFSGSRISHPGSQLHIFENLLTILVKKFYNSFKIGQHFFLQQFKTEIICNFVKFVATEKVMTTNFFSPLSFVAVLDPGSGMAKNQDPGSGIIIPDPQLWY